MYWEKYILSYLPCIKILKILFYTEHSGLTKMILMKSYEKMQTFKSLLM